MAFLGRLRSSFSFFSESWSELKKVRWPNRKEMMSYTTVVILTVAVVAIYFAVIDLGLTYILRWLFE